MTALSGRVFISHSEKDKRFSDEVLRALESRDLQCWIAPRDIPPGGSYAEAIMAAIEDCSCLVLLYTERCNDSGHVLREVERALKFKKNIVPVRFDESAPSRSLDYLLATVHWLSVTDESVETGIARVATQIASSVRPSSVQAPTAPFATVEKRAAPPMDARTSPGPGRAALLVSVVVGSVALVLILGLLLTRNIWQTLPVESAPTQTARKEMPSPTATPAAVAIAPVPARSPAMIASSPPPLPQKPAAVSESDPTDALHHYYASFEERNPSVAYSFLSAKFTANLSYKKFSENFSTTRAIRLLEARAVNRDENSATISVTLEETQADSRRVQWQGPIELVREPGGWRIDSMRGLRKVATPSADAPSTKLPVATSPPLRTPAQSWDRPRIHLELASDFQRKAATELKQRLTSSGYVVVATDDVSGNVDIPTEASELRYFTPADSAEAQRIAQELKPILGNVIAYLPEGMPYVSHARQYEIWFSQAFR